jgi:hypothetical protein
MSATIAIAIAAGTDAPVSQTTTVDFPLLNSASELDSFIETIVSSGPFDGDERCHNDKLVGLIFDFANTMSFMPKHYAAMREYMELKPEINAGVLADPENSGYVVVPGMDTVLCKWANRCAELIIITHWGPENFSVIRDFMMQLEIPSTKYRVISSKGTTQGEALKKEMNGLSGLRYVVTNSNELHLQSFREAFPTKLARLDLRKSNFIQLHN